MKFDKDHWTYFIPFPTEETNTIMLAMEKAEKTSDMKTLQWCARKLMWLYSVFKSDPFGSCEPFYQGCLPFETVAQFNKAWKEVKAEE